jgi:YVTN family beta-propeller protein
MVMNTSTHTRARLTAYLVAVSIAVGCGQAEFPVSSSAPEALVFVGDSANGMVAVISHHGGGNEVLPPIPVGSSSVGDITISEENHVFVNVTANNQIAAIDPLVEGNPVLENFLPSGTSPVHAGRDPSDGTLIWVMNDGDATSGACATAGPGGTAVSSVTVIQNHTVPGGGGGSTVDTLGEVRAEVCVGRGHHKVTFSYPSTDHPGAPRRAFVSNITDGTVSVIDANPASPTFAAVIATLDLCDSAKESAPCDANPATANEAEPHGIAYSPVSGLVYNSNEGYGTVAVIDAESATLFDVDASTPGVIDAIDIGFVGKAHVSPNGHFLVVVGVDTTSNAAHVTGKLSVVNVADHTFQTADLPDITPDSFEFTPDGDKLYVGTAMSFDNATQAGHLKNDVLLSFNTSALPAPLPPWIEIRVGISSEEHRSLAIQEHDGEASHVWVANPDDGTVSVVDVESDTVVDTLEVGGEPTSIAVLVME